MQRTQQQQQQQPGSPMRPHGAPHAARHAARRSSRGSALLAALSLLLAAATNPSLLGLLFLLAFLAWGSLCLTPTATAATSKRVWAAASGLSALALVAQSLVQAALLLGGAPRLAVPFFALLGFPRPDSLADALLVRWAVVVRLACSSCTACLPRAC